MSPHQIHLVQSSWARVQPARATAADLFYRRLFELAPDTRALFRRDMHVQGAMLMSTLDLVVRSLSSLGDVLPAAAALARRHVDYGVQPAHYTQVGQALLWTLEQALAIDFTPAMRAAWAAAYSTLSEAMQAAAYPERSADADAAPCA